jgi:hypothetical protein
MDKPVSRHMTNELQIPVCPSQACSRIRTNYCGINDVLFLWRSATRNLVKSEVRYAAVNHYESLALKCKTDYLYQHNDHWASTPVTKYNNYFTKKR